MILASILATIKLIFVDYTLDEEYQIVMAYRNLSGDTLFGTMWEPHQTSAFACVLLMRLFQIITGGTTGVVLFLRVVTTGIQLGLAVWFARTLGRWLEKEYAFLFGCCYFNMVPKVIQIPEFSNLQLWFWTVTVLALIRAYDWPGDKAAHAGTGAARTGWLVLAGAGMAAEVLAYPSSLILFPFFLYVIFRKAEKSKWVDALSFAGTCVVCAGLWLAKIMTRVSWSEFVRNVRYILDFDLTHDVSPTAGYRVMTIGEGMLSLVWPLLAAGLLGGIMWLVCHNIHKTEENHRDKTDRAILAVCLIVAAELVQIFYWVILQKGYEEPQICLLMLYIGAAIVRRQADERGAVFKPAVRSGLLTILAVIYMSDLDAWYAIPHGMLGALCAGAVLVTALGNREQKSGRKWVYLLLFSLAFCSVFGKGFTLRAGNTETNTVLGIRGLIQKGPATGIFTNYMQAYIMNCTYEDFERYVEQGENVLIVTNMVGTAGTSPYLFRDSFVSHFSIVDPTSYDERLLTYWELYPEKYPDVIVVDCWYGQLMEARDNWIMKYIEEDFGYTSVEDGRYVRFYRKNGEL